MFELIGCGRFSQCSLLLQVKQKVVVHLRVTGTLPACSSRRPPVFLRFVARSIMRIGMGLLLVLGMLLAPAGLGAPALEPIPDKLVVLTFDDSKYSHYWFVRSVLKRYKFGATFFITEGFTFESDKREYMSWSQISVLHREGFEIGNHTRDHMSIKAANLAQLEEQVEAINK